MVKVTNWLASEARELSESLEITFDGLALHPRDAHLVRDVLVMRTCLLLDLLPGSTQANPEDNRVAAAFRRTVMGLRSLDVRPYADDWKTCREIFTSPGFAENYPRTRACRRYFKRAATGRIHYKWILNATLAFISGEVDDWVRKINQWIVFDSRVNLTHLDLSYQCCREYLDFEWGYQARSDRWRKVWFDYTNVKRIGLTSREKPFLEDLQLLLVLKQTAKEMFGDFIITDYPFRPKHGNGATREVKRSEADAWHKNRYFRVDSEVINYLKYRVPEDDWRDWFYVPYKGLNRTAELVCVPKSMTSNRTISKEPTTLQYLQQDVFKALDDYFRQKPELGIDLHDQSRSRTLAELGSCDGSYATIDLSSASDSVSTDLVEFLFGDLPIGYPLMATRSEGVHVRDNAGDIDTTLSHIEKFAPMGSATCFPTECMVFAAICGAVVRVQTGRRPRRNDFVVYGDDICIRGDYADKTVDALEFLGFTVNRSKSFTGSTDSPTFRFREACGLEAVNGCDITPLRLSRRLVSITDNDADHQAGYGVGQIDLINRAYLYGFHVLRRWLNDQLKGHYWYRTALRISRSDYLEFEEAVCRSKRSWVRVAAPYVITDDSSDTQWRAFATRAGSTSPIQQCEARVSLIRVRNRTKHQDGNDYFTWCLAQATGAVDENEFVLDDMGIVTLRPRDLKWSKGWVVLSRAAHSIYPLVMGN